MRELALILSTFLSTVSVSACTARPASILEVDVVEVEVLKRVVFEGEASGYQETLQLPSQDGKILRPSDIASASSQLRAGTSPKVMELASSALLSTCSDGTQCSIKSAAAWNEFFEHSTEIEIESGYTLAEYLEQYYVLIAEVWALESPCAKDAELCMSLRESYRGPGSAFGELIFRKALFDSLNTRMDCAELITGMDGTILPAGEME